jgi:hypothetical protein
MDAVRRLHHDALLARISGRVAAAAAASSKLAHAAYNPAGLTSELPRPAAGCARLRLGRAAAQADVQLVFNLAQRIESAFHQDAPMHRLITISVCGYVTYENIL